MGVLAAFLTYRDIADESFRTSSLSVAVQATQNEQFALGLYPEIYLDSNRMRVEGSVEWMLYPFRFYGIGNNNPSSNGELYTPYAIKMQFRALHAVSGRRVQHGLSAGLRLDIRHDDIRSVDLREDGTAGPLRSGEITGSNGGWFNGLGPMVSYDTRDNNFYARTGAFCEGAVVMYGTWLGSNYEAVLSHLDLRGFATVVDDISVAGRFMMQNVGGTPTFQQWPFIGGQNNLRGVIEAQQRDRISVLLNAEVRFPIVWIVRGAAFVDAGRVADAPSNLNIDGVYVGWGGGLRFLLDPAERISLRFDVGVVRGTPQYYLGFNEAF